MDREAVSTTTPADNLLITDERGMMSTYLFPGNVLIDASELDNLPWGAVIVDARGHEWRHASFYYDDPKMDPGTLYWTDARRKDGPMFVSDTVELPARLLYATGIYAPGPDH